MGLRRQAREFAEEPQVTGGLFGVKPQIVGQHELASPPSGETVQPGTKFEPFPTNPQPKITLDRRDIVRVPVGPGILTRSVNEPSIKIIPKLVGTTNQRSPVKSPPVVGRSPVRKKEPPIPLLPTKAPKMGLDLGNLLNTGLDLYQRYETIKRGPTRVANPIPAPIPAVAAAPVTSWPGGYGVSEMAGTQFIADTAGMGGGVPFVDIITEPPAEALADGMKGWCFKKVCGVMKWVKQGRRRRRKLLTDSDYNGLLKLQTLKVNSNMNIAIAKSIGR